MTGFQLRTTVSLIAMTLFGTAASADVTAQQVWDSWKAQMGSNGEMTIGSESLDGGVLTVSGIDVSFSDDSGSASVTIDSLTFTEQGDGTVLITQSDVVPVSVTSIDPTSGAETSMTMTLTQTEAAIVASGTPELMNHAITASRFALEITDMVIDGAPGEGSVVLGFNDVAGGYATTGTASPIGLSGNFSAAAMDMFMDITADGEQVTASGKVEGISADMDGAIAIGPDVTPTNTFDMGTAFAGSYTLGATSVQVSAPDGNGADIALAGATATFDMSADVMAFDTGLTGIAVGIMDSTMPMPINLALDEFGVGLTAPAQPTDAPAPFGLRFAVRGLTASEDIWSMIDPGQVFGRDPITAVIDVTGTAINAINLYDPEAQAELAMSGAAPGEIHSLEIGEILLSAAGAEVGATGALTFDNADLTTIPGMPRPTGAIDISINGANALMDNLVAMGLIPEDQVMMARMMMGMFATPVGEDMLTSKIEFTQEGGILANGQQIQ